MILIDTSIWIEFLNGRLGQTLPPDAELQFLTCPPVLQEVFQGLRDAPAAESLRESMLAVPRLADPVPLDLYLEAADVYRVGRRKGYTIRSTVDCLIAAIAMEHRVPVWHRDSDFETIARFTALELFSYPNP